MVSQSATSTGKKKKKKKLMKRLKRESIVCPESPEGGLVDEF